MKKKIVNLVTKTLKTNYNKKKSMIKKIIIFQIIEFIFSHVHYNYLSNEIGVTKQNTEFTCTFRIIN